MRWVCKSCGWVHDDRKLRCANCGSHQHRLPQNVAVVLRRTIKRRENHASNKYSRKMPVRTWDDGLPWG